MAYTVTKNPDGDVNLGNLAGEFVTLQPAASDYPLGGYALVGGETANTNSTPNLINVDLWRILTALPVGSQGGLAPVWNPTTQKVQIYGEGPNPGITLGLGPVSAAKSTTIGVTSNVITVTIANNLVAGQFVYLQSFTAGGALNGLIVQVATASATQFTANYPTPNITAATADTTGTYQLIQAGTGNLLTTGTVANITNSLSTSSLLTMTCANTFTPGQFVIIQGLTNGATANGVIAQIATASATQFTANWTGTSFTTAADVGTASLLVTSGNAPVNSGDITASITNSLATASSAGTAGVVTLTGLQSFLPGYIAVIQGLTNGAGVNGDLLVVNAASLTNKIFVGNTKNAGFTTASDSGTAAVLVTGAPSGLSWSSGEVQPGTDLSGYAFQLLLLGY
jgi:hypothetical protein